MPNFNFVPEYLRPFVAQQDASLYTPMDHAAWRFILKISRKFFTDHAHEKYINGLRETGISLERIPLVTEMDECLQKFGWRAVPVNGFIPPSVFMEFQSLGILPIACEMRTMDHLSYTPAPDIVHEAAGHAPIIADIEYATYLKNYGEVSRKAIYSSEDMNLFEAIRNLSMVKEDPLSTEAEIMDAEKKLTETSQSISWVSEAAALARMNWWTVEYGLVGSVENPKIYGAGLLSSVGESFHCLTDIIEKRPLSLDCLETAYDITKPQPQLFVTPDFQYLTTVLNEYAQTMAFKKGGEYGLSLALKAKTVVTLELDSGIQISGKLESYINNEYLKMSGATQLSFEDKELQNQGPDYHAEGFSSILGKIKPLHRSLNELTSEEIKAHLLSTKGTLEFESGFHLKGELFNLIEKSGKIILISFKNCLVTKGTQIYFDPAWGNYDLACGSEVVSVFGGAADRKEFLTKTGGLKKCDAKPKCNLTKENEVLNLYYLNVRNVREAGMNQPFSTFKKSLTETVAFLSHPDATTTIKEDWLLRLECLELSKMFEPDEDCKKIIDSLEKDLMLISKSRADRNEMIKRGLACL